MSNIHLIQARENVISAVLRILSSERDQEHAHAADEAEYANEQLAIAARELTQATDAMPADRQPVGWNKANGEATV